MHEKGGTRCAIRPEMKCPSRESPSSLANDHRRLALAGQPQGVRELGVAACTTSKCACPLIGSHADRLIVLVVHLSLKRRYARRGDVRRSGLNGLRRTYPFPVRRRLSKLKSQWQTNVPTMPLGDSPMPPMRLRPAPAPCMSVCSRRSRTFVLISPEDVPNGELRPAFRELMAALTSEEPKGTEGRLVATLKLMDDEHAQDIAHAIIELYHALGRLLNEYL